MVSNSHIYENLTCYRGFEGGAVYTAELEGKFLIIVDQVSLVDMLDEDDREGIDTENIYTFFTEQERLEYLQRRYGRV